MAGIDPSRAFLPLNIAVLTVSDTRTFETDRSGQTLVELVTAAGHQVVARDLVPDNRDRIRAVFERWIADPAVEVVIATGGTGITPRDVTPEALAPLVDVTCRSTALNSGT